MLRLVSSISFLLGVFITVAVQAQTRTDIEGASDIPEVGRYPGSIIVGYNTSDYDTFTYPIKPLEYPNVKDYQSSLVTVEGERTVVAYDVPSNVTKSLLKVFRSIEQGLEKKGFKTILSCGGQASGCGSNFIYYTFPKLTSVHYKINKFKSIETPDLYTYVGSLVKGSEKYIVFAIVGKYKSAPEISYLVDIVKINDFIAEELVLTVDTITDGINSKGTVTLGGLYFDHNKVTLTQASEPSLQAAADYLAGNPDSQFLVVGHTDNQGDFTYNRNLSQARAKSVIDALNKKLGSKDSIQLKPFGVAYAAPVASNESSSGRAENRRVELVLVKR